MATPRANVAPPLTMALLISASLLLGAVRMDIRAQQSSLAVSDDSMRGIKLYKQGDTKGAIEALRVSVKLHSDDADSWHFLGLALHRDGNLKEARKAFEKAIKLRPDFAVSRTSLAYTLLLSNKLKDAEREANRALALKADNPEAHYIVGAVHLIQGKNLQALEQAEAALKVQSNFSPALLLKSQALSGVYADKSTPARSLRADSKEASAAIREFEKEPPEVRELRRKQAFTLLKEASDSLEQFLKLTPNPVSADLWRQQLETLRIYTERFDKPEAERTVFSPDEVTTKARITYKVAPPYTEKARQAGVSGTVRLQVVLAVDGTVQHILVLQALPYGLAEAAVEVARKIKFIPAIKDGRPVSQITRIEYNFNLY